MSQKLLYLLLALFIALNVLPSVTSKLEKNVHFYHLLQTKINKEQQFLDNNQSISEQLTKTVTTQTQNIPLVWSKDTADSVIFSTIQEEIKKLCATAHGTTDSVTWGEPLVLKEGTFKILPLKVRLRLAPENFELFLNSFLHTEKLYTIDSLSMIKEQKQKIILIDMQLQGYKIHE